MRKDVREFILKLEAAGLAVEPTSGHMSISLDGFVAGPDQSLEHPLGRRGIELHHWHLDEPLHEADAHGLQLFARIDHAAGGCKADIDLEPDVLLIFGNARVGTPLMQADARVGIELPLRMLIWQDPDGTHVGYLDPRELADRYALDGHQQTLERQSTVLNALAAAAAG